MRNPNTALVVFCALLGTTALVSVNEMIDLDDWRPQQPATIATPEPTSDEAPVVAADEAAAPAPDAPVSDEETPVDVADGDDEVAPQTDDEIEVAEQQPAAAEEATEAELQAPVPQFDVVRAEPDGSLVIAGTGPANAAMEIVAGAETVATATAGSTGDFAAVLDDPLPPGDYQIVLRATSPDGVVVTSRQTAVVAIPEAGSETVLALVEEPGAPSRLITVPQTGETAMVPAEPGEVAEMTDQEAVEGSQEQIAALPEVAEQSDQPVETPADDAALEEMAAAAAGEAAEMIESDVPAANDEVAASGEEALAAEAEQPADGPESDMTDLADQQAAEEDGAAAPETDVAADIEDQPADIAAASEDEQAPMAAESTQTEGAPETVAPDEAEDATQIARVEPDPVAPDAEPDATPTEPNASAVQTAETETVVEQALLDLRIEAVEIDGIEVFVAGAATPGTRLRVYANEILLGDTTASEVGRFLVQARRDLPVGDYIIRADAIEPTTADVIKRASVPFVRSEGERLAAVAATAEPEAQTVEPVDATEEPLEESTAAPETEVPARTVTVEPETAAEPPSLSEPGDETAIAAAATQTQPADGATTEPEAVDEMHMADASPTDAEGAEPIAVADDEEAASEVAAVAPTEADDAASPQRETVTETETAGEALASDPSAKEPAAVETPAPAEPIAPATQTAAVPAEDDAVGTVPQPVEEGQAEAMVPVAGSVIIRRGDTLWQISRRVYGRGVKYTTIYLANQDQITDPGRIWPGQVFDVPRDADEDAEQTHRALRDQTR